jgi:hypothetical protein
MVLAEEGEQYYMFMIFIVANGAIISFMSIFS